jgi:hypothetical protein
MMERSLIGCWEVDPSDRSSLAAIGPTALRVFDESRLEFIEMRDHSIFRLRLAHAIRCDRLSLYASYSAGVGPAVLGLDWVSDRNAVKVTDQDRGSVVFRRLVGPNPQLWGDLSEAEFREASASAGGVARFFPGFAGFVNREDAG